ncbi:MAG: DNA topoisomerase (ATP-hydrolyzing) subunit A [Hormoscilla sp.]
MAKQLNLFTTGQVIATDLHTEMQRSYLEYAMSVIVGRALPDVRDGLKPVHRRILYAMHELGLTPDKPYRKCARVVGDVLGKYHPHGDQAVYDALVRMVQDFSCRYPLLAGHGNFGSVDNDPPAAMRYTETRLAPIGNEALLSEISSDTVDFTDNFDNSQAEPVVLPAQLPVLLLNGCSGIAVGMATNIPPHNLGEVVEGLIALIDNPEISDDKLLGRIPGPDFPTGGEIMGTEGIKSAYTTGKGSIIVRGVASIEQIHSGSRGRRVRDCIVVTELPYQVNKAAWIEKIADLVNTGKIEGISNVRDESDRTGMRVVIELKRETNPKAILDRLYKLTPLQSTFGAILLALVEGQPRQLTLRQMLQEFLDFRLHTLARQYRNELQEAEKRLHLVEGLLGALRQIDAVLDILRNSPDGTTAKAMLHEQLQFSDRQSDAILAMPMRRLLGLERNNFETELAQLSSRIQELQRLLTDRNYLLLCLKKELLALKRKYGNRRRTKIVRRRHVPDKEPKQPKPKNNSPRKNNSPSKVSTQSTIAKKTAIEPSVKTSVEFTYRGSVRRTSVQPDTTPDSQTNRSFTEGYALKPIDDFTILSQVTQTKADVLLFTQDGFAYAIKVGQIPLESRGTSLIGLLPQHSDRRLPDIVAQFILCDYQSDRQIVTLTKTGRMKRLPLSEFAHIKSRGLSTVKFKDDDDQLLSAHLTQTGEQLLIATAAGRILRLDVNDRQMPIRSRTAVGYQAIHLHKQDRLVGCAAVRQKDSFLVVTRRGYAKRMLVNLLPPPSARGDMGSEALKFTSPTDSLAAITLLNEDSLAIVLTNTERLWQFPTASIGFWNTDGPGDRLLQLRRDEIITTVLSIRLE